MPKDKISGTHQGYGFVEFRTEEDADYAVKVLSSELVASRGAMTNGGPRVRASQ